MHNIAHCAHRYTVLEVNSGSAVNILLPVVSDQRTSTNRQLTQYSHVTTVLPMGKNRRNSLEIIPFFVY